MEAIKSQLKSLTEDSQGKVNYESWKFKLDLDLKTKIIYDIAYGFDVRLHGNDTDAAVSQRINKNLEAHALIGLYWDSNVAKKISKCSSVAQMLEKFETFYRKKSEVSVTALQRKIIN